MPITSCWFLIFQAFSPNNCKNSQGQLLLSNLVFMGIVFFVQVPWCDSLFLSPFCACGFLPPKVSLFSPPLHLCPSYPLWCGLYSTFSCRVSCTSLQVIFWFIYTDMSVIYLYLWDKGSLWPFHSTVFPVSLLLLFLHIGKQYVLNKKNLYFTEVFNWVSEFLYFF